MAKKIRYTTEDFIRIATKQHGNIYNYTNTVYKTSHELVTIRCNIHGLFKQKACSHLRGFGCNQCGIDRTRNDFLIKARDTHGDVYDYSKVKYSRSCNKVEIVCDSHGSFFQEANSHILGHGCPRCARDNRGSDGVYCDAYFVGNNKDIAGIFYIIEMSNKIEKFLKIGITKNSLHSRYGSQQVYQYATITEQKMPLFDAYKKEQQLLSKYSNFKYNPTFKFGGHTECFEFTALEELTSGH